MSSIWPEAIPNECARWLDWSRNWKEPQLKDQGDEHSEDDMEMLYIDIVRGDR